ncbi:hypothetical protein GSI_04799 [Ganoderma sinense ZZ0214-1]|uniref:BTB domain-containing protein n=1 Tax=Ganoderma sinense ZZ0214-1 TaxID=1077348 RepID=A0A2G8SIG1_9APHY|nr:hypothetical protein GSI_04799 [Ganoderma sinense ZZ0214-1]
MAVPGAALQPDPVFFPMAEFQVEGFLFRVPLYIFQQSQFFRENVLAQSQREAAAEADAPYELQDTTAAEFRDLLRCILPMAGPFPSGATALTNVLKLATRWKFDFARRVAIRKIAYTVDSPALKLVLARAYAVPEFLPSALGGLVDAPALEVDDYEVLGRTESAEASSLELVAKVVKYRERARRARCERKEQKRESAAATDPDPAQRRRLVEEIFGAEFARDYRKGEEIIAARAMALTQPQPRPPPPPAHRSRPCL